MIEGLIVRDATLEDRNFIFKSVLHHYRNGSPHTQHISDQVFFDNHSYLVSKVMKIPGNVIKMAALSDDPDVVFGFAWGNVQPETLHYVYVKRAFRRMGIAACLVRAIFDEDVDEIFYTHHTRDMGFIAHRTDRFVFNPYLLHGDLWKLNDVDGHRRTNS